MGRQKIQFESMVRKIEFGHNIVDQPNLTGLILGYDRGCVFRDFIAKMDCGSRIRSTLNSCPWKPIIYDQQVGVDGKRK